MRLPAEIVLTLAFLAIAFGAYAAFGGRSSSASLHRCYFMADRGPSPSVWMCIGRDTPDPRSAPDEHGRARTKCKPFGWGRMTAWACARPT